VGLRADRFARGRGAIFEALRETGPDDTGAGRGLLAETAARAGERERILSDRGLAGYVAEIRDQADVFLNESLLALPFSLYRLFDETGDRLAFEAPYFERRRRLVSLALAAWLWQTDEYLRGLEDAMWAICDEYAWALPAHLSGSSLEARASHAHRTTLDLFACETAFALAEIRSLLADALSPAVSERARRECEERVIAPFIARKSPLPWEEMRNNWCAVCAGSVGAAALYLIEDDERLSAVIERVLPSLDKFMESFPDDGACLEGIGYWTYGVGFFLSFSELLRESTDGIIDLSANGKFKRVAAFQSKAYLNDSLAVSFADGEPGERYRIGLTALLSRSFPGSRLPPKARAAGFVDDRNGRFCLCLRDLVWGSRRGGDEEGARSEPTEKASWFSESQWLIRPARGLGRAAFAAKGGHNGEPHNHNDIGSFQFVLGPLQLLADLGRGEYTRDYFGDKRYDSFCASSFGHRLPIIDGAGQAAGEGRRGRDVVFIEKGEEYALSMDIAAAYGLPGLASLIRRFEYDGGETLSLSDEYFFEGRAAPVIERFVTLVPASDIAFDESRKICTLGFEGGRLEISCSDEQAAASLVTHGHRSPDGALTEIASIDYALSRDRPRFCVEFEFTLHIGS
jgi:hypothetical protein